MAMRPLQRQAKRLVAAGFALLAAAAAASAGPQQTSAPLTVSVTVVRSCTIGDAKAALAGPGTSTATGVQGTSIPTAAPAATPTYSVRCGTQSLAGPTTPGSQASAVTKGAPVSVTKTADGRVFLVQF